MRERFTHKKIGDSLSAGQVNKLGRVARNVGTPMTGAYLHGRANANLQDEPFFRTTAEITEDKDAPIYEIRERYYDVDAAIWKTEPESETTAPWDLDSTEPAAQTFAKGDIVDAWWHPQRGMFITTASSVGTTIRFEITEACCDECWADVIVLSRPCGTNSVPGEGAAVTQCGSSSTKQLAACEVRVYDLLGCLLVETAAGLLGRRGYATWMENNDDAECAVGVGGDCSSIAVAGCRWEMTFLCPPVEECPA